MNQRIEVRQEVICGPIQSYHYHQSWTIRQQRDKVENIIFVSSILLEALNPVRTNTRTSVLKKRDFSNNAIMLFTP